MHLYVQAKCSKSISGWVCVGPLNAPLLRAPLCGANKISIGSFWRNFRAKLVYVSTHTPTPTPPTLRSNSIWLNGLGVGVEESDQTGGIQTIKEDNSGVMSAQRTVQIDTDADIRSFWWGHPILTIITDNFSFAHSSFPTACLIAIHIKLCDWMSHLPETEWSLQCPLFDCWSKSFELFFSQNPLLCPGATMWQPQKPF